MHTDQYQNVRMSYLRGASGFILVVDGTRQETLGIALELKKKVEEHIGPVPFVMVLNTSDLSQDWELTEADIADLKDNNWDIIRGSAKTGLGVNDCFAKLAERMLQES